MSDSGYEWYLKLKKNYAIESADLIKEVNESTNTPQNILLAKTVANLLSPNGDGYMRNADDFFFTESLVNKLMHFAYLHGKKQIFETSFNQGWNDCLSDIRKSFMPVAEKLDFVHNDGD